MLVLWLVVILVAALIDIVIDRKRIMNRIMDRILSGESDKKTKSAVWKKILLWIVFVCALDKICSLLPPLNKTNETFETIIMFLPAISIIPERLLAKIPGISRKTSNLMFFFTDLFIPVSCFFDESLSGALGGLGFMFFYSLAYIIRLNIWAIAEIILYKRACYIIYKNDCDMPDEDIQK